jgi:hypothetical protein
MGGEPLLTGRRLWDWVNEFVQNHLREFNELKITSETPATGLCQVWYVRCHFLSTFLEELASRLKLGHLPTSHDALKGLVNAVVLGGQATPEYSCARRYT